MDERSPLVNKHVISINDDESIPKFIKDPGPKKYFFKFFIFKSSLLSELN